MDVDCMRTRAAFRPFLEGKLSRAASSGVRSHLETCKECWSEWNSERWKRARLTRDFDELAEYLGEDPSTVSDPSWELANEWYRRAPETEAEVEAFYAETPWYVRTLALWQASGQRPRYVDLADPWLVQLGSTVVCDFGCGIGTDGLRLMEKGLSVIFVDLNRPALDFVRWRLTKRKLSAVVIYLNQNTALPEFDTLWAMDVIEHLPNPERTLEPVAQKAIHVIYDTEWSGTSGGRHPFHFEHPPSRIEAIWHHAGMSPLRTHGDVKVWSRSSSHYYL